MNYMLDLLDRYSKEISAQSNDIDLHLSLEQLINSHRELRSQVLLSREEQNSRFGNIRKNVIIQARESVLNGEYVAIDKLKTMTITEISELIERNSPDVK